jgi:NADP-dependent 3-hydroxy acid dehydrogenase YdfG
MADLTGKTALVTGASKGIGFSIAELMVKAGMNVLITSRHEAEINQAAQTLTQIGPGKALGLASDARDYHAQERAVAETLKSFGRLDVLIANAGVGHFKPVDELSLDEWHDVIDINLTGVFYSVKAAVEALKQSQGFIITIASLAGVNFFPAASAYNASKFGLVGFTQSIMLDLRKYDVKVSTIMPGSVATYFNEHTPSDEDAWKIQPEDIAEMVMYLLNTPAQTLPSKIEVRPSRPPGS